MALVEVTLNSYRYHFRRLTWQEEACPQFSKTEDQRKTIMARALVDVSGLPVSPEQALTILKNIPDAVFWRMWVVYRGDLPEDRYYTSGGLYEAPDQMAYRQRIYDDGVADAATAKLENQFGRDGVEEAENISRQMFRNASSLTKAGPSGGKRSGNQGQARTRWETVDDPASGWRSWVHQKTLKIIGVVSVAWVLALMARHQTTSTDTIPDQLQQRGSFLTTTEAMITTAKAAAMIGISPATLRGWKAQRIGPPFIQLSPRCVRYDHRDILRYVNERRVVPACEAGRTQ